MTITGLLSACMVHKWPLMSVHAWSGQSDKKALIPHDFFRRRNDPLGSVRMGRIDQDVVKAMSAEGIADVKRGLDYYVSSAQQTAAWTALLNSIDAFDQGVLLAIAHGYPPLSRNTIKLLEAIPGAKPTLSKLRTSIERLKRNGILAKTAAGTMVDDPLFAEFLTKKEFNKNRAYSEVANLGDTRPIGKPCQFKA